eukprot:10138796-Heterocapsa_arctica.AAC.1
MHSELPQCRLKGCSIERLSEHISLTLATWAIRNVAVQPRLSIDLTRKWVLFDARGKHLVQRAYARALDSRQVSQVLRVALHNCCETLAVVLQG